MRTLRFVDGRAAFVERSCLPLGAACAIASGVRERLSALLGTQVSLCVLEPEIPSARAWKTIARSARFYRVSGSAADAAIVLRERDGAAVAAALFGESPASGAERALSPIECDVLDRAAAALSGTLSLLCGDQPKALPPSAAELPDAYVTYFELALDRPVTAHIGIALSRDPVPEPSVTLTPADLAELPLEASVAIDVGNLTAAALTALAPGEIVPITRPSAFRGSLRIGGRTLATGTCGVRDGRYAIEIEGCVA